ncbi:MAG: hypothetical protein K6E85_07060 [Lachnospiraceae bacterium]|nr:hypothetical protein [Lachnospiraceae bacterium]
MSLNLNEKSTVYLFSACNAKTLAIADSTPAENSAVIFACSSDSLTAAEKAHLKPLNAKCVDMTISGIIWELPKNIAGIEIFLFENENENLLLLDEACTALAVYPLPNAKVYFEVNDTPIGAFDKLTGQNGTEDQPLFVPVRTEMNFAYDNLLKHSVFANAERGNPDKQDNLKHIKALIVGMNERNYEIFRTLLHLSQMPGYALKMMVIEDCDNWERIVAKIPEIYEMQKNKEDPIDIHYYEDVDLDTEKFENYIEDCLPDFNYAFVNADDDLTNLNLGLRLKTFLIRNGRAGKADIQVNVLNRGIYLYWDRDLMNGIETVGSTDIVYNYRAVTIPDIEMLLAAIGETEGGANIFGKDFSCLPEYNRISNLARLLSLRYKIRLIEECYDSDYRLLTDSSLWKKYEHFRWEAFVRSLGYVRPDAALMGDISKIDAITRKTGKVHPSLTDFNKLSQEEQDKDGIELTEEVVKIFSHFRS